MRRRDHQALRSREGDKRLIILFDWPKSLSELLRAQIMTVLGTGRVIELVKQSDERLLIAQRQPDHQV